MSIGSRKIWGEKFICELRKQSVYGRAAFIHMDVILFMKYLEWKFQMTG